MTMPATPARVPIEIGALLSQSWKLYKRNWIVALPTVIAAVVVAVLFAALAVTLFYDAFAAIASHETPRLSSQAVSFALASAAIVVVLGMLVNLWAVVATYAMANAAWLRGAATFSDGNAAFFPRAGSVFLAIVGIFGIAVLALILALPTLGLSIFAISLVTIFVMPAVVAGGRGGFQAIGESIALIRRFFVPSLIAWIVLYAIQYGLGLPLYFAFMPLQFSMIPTGSSGTLQMPPIETIAFSGAVFLLYILVALAYVGFTAIVQVGLYRDLTAQTVPAQIS